MPSWLSQTSGTDATQTIIIRLSVISTIINNACRYTFLTLGSANYTALPLDNYVLTQSYSYRYTASYTSWTGVAICSGIKFIMAL